MEWVNAKMWSRVMTMVVKNLNPHQMIHFCVDVMTVISTSMWGRKMNPNFGHDGKYHGCQSYLGLHETNKIYLCCLHHQKFHLKKNIIVVIVVCSETVSTIAPTNLNVVFSFSKLHKRGRGLEDLISHWGFLNDGLKKVKLEFPKHDLLKVPEIQDDLESSILKVWCVKIL